MSSGMTARILPLLLVSVALAAVPMVTRDYFLHIAIQILLWGFIYTAWSLMGKFGLVSLGHGAFLGIGAYIPALLWNTQGVPPWLGIPLAIVLAVLLGLVIGYPCFRLRVVDHYFALVTLALSQVVLLTIVAARDITGGSLGMTPKTVGHS
jgi:branched-chain amino acid transport system permease protein